MNGEALSNAQFNRFSLHSFINQTQNIAAFENHLSAIYQKLPRKSSLTKKTQIDKKNDAENGFAIKRKIVLITISIKHDNFNYSSEEKCGAKKKKKRKVSLAVILQVTRRLLGEDFLFLLLFGVIFIYPISRKNKKFLEWFSILLGNLRVSFLGVAFDNVAVGLKRSDFHLLIVLFGVGLISYRLLLWVFQLICCLSSILIQNLWFQTSDNEIKIEGIHQRGLNEEILMSGSLRSGKNNNVVTKRRQKSTFPRNPLEIKPSDRQFWTIAKA